MRVIEERLRTCTCTCVCVCVCVNEEHLRACASDECARVIFHTSDPLDALESLRNEAPHCEHAPAQLMS